MKGVKNGKNTNELLDILKSCSNPTHLKEALDLLPESGSQTLSNYLAQLLAEKGLSRAKVIEQANLARAYGYQIFQGEKQPSRDKLLAIAFAMHLSLDECNRMLTLAHANILYSKNRRDAILIYGLAKGISIYEVNDLLLSVEEEALNG